MTIGYRNGSADDENNGFGITESYFKYRSFPDNNGLRYQARMGFMYPKISLENVATGWSSPYTLSYSTMNSWLGEEVRHLGLEAGITKLGKFSGSNHDFSLSAVLFTANDPNGAMLAWHGWTQSSRQSFWNEKLDFPQIPVLDDGEALEVQARRSDPFKELDSLSGYQITGQWDWRGKVKLLAGYYDNRTATDVVEDGQYTWMTQFSHLSVKWQLEDNFTLLFQHMSGDTRMRVVNNFDVVALNFSNSFLLLTKKWHKFRFSTRIERFETDDLDGLVGDNNDEDGKGVTLSLAYEFSKQLFFHLEYNYLDSIRPSRYYYAYLDKDSQEKQLQLAARYYF